MRLVSLGGIDELAAIVPTDTGLRIGSMASIATVAETPAFTPYQAVCDAARSIAGPSVRNTATIGGNICNASPSADLSVALMAADAVTVIRRQDGSERRLPLSAFFTGPGRTALQSGEYLRSIELEASRPGERSWFRKLGVRTSMEIAIVNVAVRLAYDSDGVCTLVRIALGAVGPTVLRAYRAEEAILGVPSGGAEWASAVELAAGIAASDIQPITDLRAGADYRRDMIRVMVREGLSA
jgi:CO/xanthine dehydrogenase FAD-binding subunit